MIRELASFHKYLPAIESPKVPPSLADRFKYTFIILLIYFLMYHTFVIGIKGIDASTNLISTLTASRLGTLLTLGITPMIIASLLLQLLVKGEIFKFDLSDQKNIKIFQEAQVTFAIIIAMFQGFFSAASMVGFDGLGPFVADGFRGNQSVFLLVFIQIVLGAIIIIYLDQISTKYGLTSGISLFIAAGVSFSILSLIGYLLLDDFIGIIPNILSQAGIDRLQFVIIQMIPIIVTILAIYIISYVQSYKLPIPLNIGGQSRKIEIPFFYLTTIPVIFSSALLFIFNQLGMAMMGVPGEGLLVDVVRYIGAIFYILGPVFHNYNMSEYLAILFTGKVPILNIPEYIHLVIYIIAMAMFSMIFGVVWAEATGQDGKSVAKIIMNNPNVSIEGYRRDPRMLEKMITEYIDGLIKLSSFSIGLIAGIGDAVLVLGTSTGILLMISIYDKIIPQIKEFLKVYNPMILKILGE
ncbi:MAG: hypothetical protein N3C61_02525 [Candidatus Micrarchaeota archaeon]|nr:hypothetical protein [Candidatus Micrarchaeota archaeon]